MRVGLMADVPDQLVIGRVENIVKGDRQFDHAETRTEMAARYRDRADRLGAQFICNLLKVSRIDTTQICRIVNRVENSRLHSGASSSNKREFACSETNPFTGNKVPGQKFQSRGGICVLPRYDATFKPETVRVRNPAC